MTAGARDVIVIGGGIAGCLTAYLLAQRGMSVTILEADSVGSHASGFAFGGLGPLEGSGIPDPLLDFSVWCFRKHAALAEELQEATGIDTQFQLRDRLNLAFSEQDVADYRKDLEWQQGVEGFNTCWLSPEEVVKLEPRANPECLGAAYAEGMGAVEAYRYNLAVAQAGEGAGVEMMLRRASGLRSQGDRCVGVDFQGGSAEAATVVLAVGPWSGEVSS